MSDDTRICKICKKEYDYDIERTIGFMEDGIGMEYVVCEKCFEKYKKIIMNGVKK